MSLHADPLWYWMTERQKIFKKRKEGLPAPWTKDPILQQFKFCNVFREQDAVTKFIREKVRNPFRNHQNLWFMLAMCRIYNLPATIRALHEEGYPAWPEHSDLFDLDFLYRVTQERIDDGYKLYTGAYIIAAPSNPSNPWFGLSKQEYIAKGVLGGLWRNRESFKLYFERRGRKTLEETWEFFRQYLGWGPFMAYEVVTDLRHTRYLRAAPDTMTWANAGPGAVRGLRRLCRSDGRLKGCPPVGVNRSNALPLMRELLAEAPRNLPRWFPDLELRDIQHSLCEVDKYLRVKNGEGRPRSTYQGTNHGSH